MPREKTEDCVFSVDQSFQRGLVLRAGYCEAYLTKSDLVIPLIPFRQARVLVRYGSIECRESWTPPRGMSRGQYSFAQHPRQCWMNVDIADVRASTALCCDIGVVLPVDGKLRRFD